MATHVFSTHSQNSSGVPMGAAFKQYIPIFPWEWCEEAVAIAPIGQSFHPVSTDSIFPYDCCFATSNIMTNFLEGFNGRWVSVDYFNQIIISPKMISDHLPNAVHNALKQLVSSSGNFP
ncbi:hypothetical protein CEXT_253191 [Caerostris extrusa]|uniref:Uncharacterized protein n=1 Tax=Caerostris extrusa TaxID=172846 RepID=A0AAV4T9P2_CAEEX|nr:hypothetical protein CEXT_253191 [Caerostris extrusa]